MGKLLFLDQAELAAEDEKKRRYDSIIATLLVKTLSKLKSKISF